MNRLLTTLVVLVLCTGALAQGTSRAVFLNYLAQPSADDNGDNYDHQPALELGFLYGQSKAPGHMVGFAGEVALRASTPGGDDGEVGNRDADVDTFGGRVGGRYYLDVGTPRVQPYVGAGLIAQRTRAELNGSNQTEVDTDLDVVATVGIDSQVYNQIRANAGINLTADQGSSALDLDQVSGFLGLGWGF